MKDYELAYLISPDVSGEELTALAQKINDFIIEEGGNLDKKEEPAKKKLAYSIKKKNEAFFGVFNFKLEPAKITGLEKKLKSENRILRYLLIAKKITVARPARIFAPPKKTAKEEPAPSLVKEHKKVELKELDKEIEQILKE